MSDSAQSLWPHAGYAQLKTDARGHLTVTDDFLRVLLHRPELAPIDSSCAHEIQIHERLIESPRLNLQASDLAPIQDPDAAENMRVWLRFRDRILAKPTLEASYWALFEGAGVDVPPVLVNQITQVLVQHVLGDDCTPLEARAAELLFRTQKYRSSMTARSCRPITKPLSGMRLKVALAAWASCSNKVAFPSERWTLMSFKKAIKTPTGIAVSDSTWWPA